MDEYMTVKDVAAMTLVSERTVFRWMQLGRIRPVRIGGTIRFKKSRLLMDLERHEYGGEPKHDPAMG